MTTKAKRAIVISGTDDTQIIERGLRAALHEESEGCVLEGRENSFRLSAPTTTVVFDVWAQNGDLHIHISDPTGRWY